MLYRDLLNQLRFRLDDMEEPYLWSDLELYTHLGKATILFISSVYGNNIMFEKKVSVGDYQVDLSDIVLDLNGIMGVILNGRSLDRNVGLNYGVATPATPLYWNIDYANTQLLLDPPTDEDITIQIYFNGAVDFRRLSYDMEVPLNPEHQVYILDGAAAFAYLKKDSEAYNEKEYQKCMQMFINNMEIAKRDIMRSQSPIYNKMFDEVFF